VGSVIAIEDAQGTRRFQASGSHTTPNGKWSARAPGYRLGGFDVGQVARSMGHDEAGRVESDGHQEYVFDDEGLLAEVKGGAQEGYLYDGLGRLVGKVRADGQLAEALVHDGAQLVEAWRSGSLAWTATWGPGLDNLVSIIDEQADEYLTLDDGKGSVMAWVKAGETQATTWAEYTVEGRATYHHEKAGTTCVEEDDVRCDKPFDVPFGFHSAYGSSTTGLLYFRNRWYSPESGEWLSQDPLGNVDSDNLYAFNGFDPVNFVDPWGLEMGGVAGPRELETGAKFFDQKPKVNTDGLLELIAQEETASLLRQIDLNGGTASWAAMAPGAAQGTGWSGVRGGVSQLTLAYSGVDATLAKPPPPVRAPGGLRKPNLLFAGCLMAESCRRMLEMPLSEIVDEIRDAFEREFLRSSRGMRSMPTPPFPRASAGSDEKPPSGPSETAGAPEPAKPEAPAPEPQAGGAGALQPPPGVRVGGGEWKALEPGDNACQTGCEDVALSIRHAIGGEIKIITGPARFLGRVRNSAGKYVNPAGTRAPGWSEHHVVVKDGKVYDALTGPGGMETSAYKGLWEYADVLKFGF
jgi:RHS repeat-associated protein